MLSFLNLSVRNRFTMQIVRRKPYCLIRGLFIDHVSNTDNIKVWRTARHPLICPEVLRKPMKLLRIANSALEIRTEYLGKVKIASVIN